MVIQLLVWVVIAGIVVWLVNALVPMDPKFKMVFNAIVGIALLLWVLYDFGLLAGPVPGRPLGRFC